MSFKVKKGNRILTIGESEKGYYLSEGYDVVAFNDENKKYEVTETATGGKSYTVAEYNAIKAERVELEAENAKLKAQIAKLKKDAPK